MHFDGESVKYIVLLSSVQEVPFGIVSPSMTRCKLRSVSRRKRTPTLGDQSLVLGLRIAKQGIPSSV